MCIEAGKLVGIHLRKSWVPKVEMERWRKVEMNEEAAHSQLVIDEVMSGGFAELHVFLFPAASDYLLSSLLSHGTLGPPPRAKPSIPPWTPPTPTSSYLLSSLSTPPPSS